MMYSTHITTLALQKVAGKGFLYPVTAMWISIWVKMLRKMFILRFTTGLRRKLYEHDEEMVFLGDLESITVWKHMRVPGFEPG